MTKETFKQALYNNLPPLQEWDITKTEFNKLLDNIQKYLPIKDITDIPKSLWSYISNLNQELPKDPNTNIFFHRGGSPYLKIYDNKKKKYYSINSKQGQLLVKYYSQFVN